MQNLAVPDRLKSVQWGLGRTLRFIHYNLLVPLKENFKATTCNVIWLCVFNFCVHILLGILSAAVFRVQTKVKYPTERWGLKGGVIRNSNWPWLWSLKNQMWIVVYVYRKDSGSCNLLLLVLIRLAFLKKKQKKTLNTNAVSSTALTPLRSSAQKISEPSLSYNFLWRSS